MTAMPEFPEALERRITIRARPETVFRFFTDSSRFAKWWGEGSRIDPRQGGQVVIQYPGGVVVDGEVLEIDVPRRIVFTYRYASGIPADGSLVTISLEESAQGTILNLRHAFSSAKIRDTHVQGWRYQLAVFSRAVAEDELPAAVERIDAWLRAWGDPDAAQRRALLTSCATDDVVFRDAYSATEGLEDLLAHLQAVQFFMPGVTLARDGDVRLSHGTALARWTATRADGAAAGTGTNVYDLSPDGRFARVVGFWES
jgi:uncharacterized protein YndB with AHSA1/START domain